MVKEVKQSRISKAVAKAAAKNKHNAADVVKPSYTITELGDLYGYSRQGMVKVIKRLNIPMHLHGSKYIIYLSDIVQMYPELYMSILEAYGILAQLNNHKMLIQYINEQLSDNNEAFGCLSQFL